MSDYEILEEIIKDYQIGLDFLKVQQAKTHQEIISILNKRQQIRDLIKKLQRTK